MTTADDDGASAAAREPGKLRLSLLESAYDSVNDSLENADLAEEHSRKWKLAIFLLVHSLELLMKERLRREHRLLVFSNVDRPVHTVSMELALARLQTLGVGIDLSDQHAIRTAIGWRDRIAHYEVDLTIEDAKSIYALVFEFLHSFHERELGEDLHTHISEQNWWKEAQLIEVFRSDFVTYNGVDVIKTWPAEIVAAQDLVDIEIEGQIFQRVAYGQEPFWAEASPGYASSPCHDCAIVAGQLHVPGCDAEQCPRCQTQLITCACTVTSPMEDEPELAQESKTTVDNS